MDIIEKITQAVNPGQTPVLTVDQPLYAIAKKIQWKWPDQYGENKFVVLMGGLHIEMAVLKVLGDWLNKSGWTYLISAANVTTEARAEHLLQGSNVSRCQWVHQVTAAALHTLMYSSYGEYKDCTPEPHLCFQDWCVQMVSIHPQFSYWYKTLKLELLFLRFLRAQRELNFTEYIASIIKITPWMFAMDHFHYARWLAVHVVDLLHLQKNSEETYQEFLKGNFVTQKTCNKFSAMAHDQVHEQLNAMVKGDGGVIGITENDGTLRRWSVAGPETARVLSEYTEIHCSESKMEGKHHEQIPSVQKTFFENVKNLCREFEEAGNPFSDTSEDLFTLDNKNIMPESVKKSVETAENIGNRQFQAFVSERLSDKPTIPFFDSIPKNNLPMFNSPSEKKTSKDSNKMSGMAQDVNLFSRLYIASQGREVDMDNFFAHENHPWPPALSSSGKLNTTSKSDLIHCLKSEVPFYDIAPEVDAKVVDGAALVHSLDPKNATERVKTFQDYAENIFLPKILRMLEPVLRLDLVWDRYLENSLKTQTREDRGSGTLMKVGKDFRLPANWKNFLRSDQNKHSLFKLLAKAIQEFQFPQHKQVITSFEEKVLSSPITMTGLQELQCKHEEADTRLLFHTKHIIDQGMEKVLIQATDTDVVVIATAVAHTLDCELWVAFGHGDKVQFIPCHLLSSKLGPLTSEGLLYFQAFTGCDVTSAFRGIGKKTAWSVYIGMPELQQLFADLSKQPTLLSESEFELIERFTVLLYQKTSELTSVNDLRKQLFSHNRKIENIPPTAKALEQHAKRATYVAGFIWGQTLKAHQVAPSPEQWGWIKDPLGSLTPNWTTLPEASKACKELLKCGCRTRCIKRWCKCVQANMPCTDLCTGCSGQCEYNANRSGR